MKILVLADIHGDRAALDKVLDSIKEGFDVVICPGDVTDMFNIPKEFSQMDMADMIIQKILALKKPLLCVPGNHDPYEMVHLLDDYGINLHEKVKKMGGVKFAGWGGALTPFNTIFEPTEEETTEALALLGGKVNGDFILVVHAPPKNTTLDRVASGEHVGSEAVRGFILEKQPLLAVSAHIHEAGGTDKLGKTTVFYPGPVYEGWYGIVILEGKTVKCERKQIKLD